MNGVGATRTKSQFMSLPLCYCLYIQQCKTIAARERRVIREAKRAEHLESTYAKEHAQEESKNEAIRTTTLVSVQVALNL